MLESRYQRNLIKKLKAIMPNCFIIKNDANYIQGLPDLLILNEDKWGALEVKRSPDAAVQPNQQYYVDLFNEMSFAAFIDPTNEEDVLYDLEQALQPRRKARLPKA